MYNQPNFVVTYILVVNSAVTETDKSRVQFISVYRSKAQLLCNDYRSFLSNDESGVVSVRPHVTGHYADVWIGTFSA